MGSGSAASRLPFLRKLGYGLGDLGLVMAWQMVGLFLLYFLTEVVGLAPALAGAIIFGGLIWDGITDIAMGAIADRTRSRIGRYRPWLLIGAPLLALSLPAVFWVPPLSGAALVWAVITIQLLFRLCFTIVGIPYGALSSAMTNSSDERGALTGYRMTFSTVASLLVAVGVPPAVEWLGGASARLGYFLTAGCVGCAAMILILVCFASSREPKVDPAAAPQSYRIGELPSLLTANDAFLRVAACIACQATSMAILLSGAPYFFTYVRSEPESLGPSMALLISGVAMSIPIWTLVSRRIGKRATWMAGAAWAALALGLSAFLAQGPYPVFLAMVGFASIGIGAVVLTSFAMLPDTVEYGEWKTGRRIEAGLFSALVLAQKAATGLATWLIGLLLQWIGHSPQTPMTGAGAQLFGLALYLIPAALLTGSILIIRRYPLSARFHAQLVNEIAVRKARA